MSSKNNSSGSRFVCYQQTIEISRGTLSVAVETPAVDRTVVCESQHVHVTYAPYHSEGVEIIRVDISQKSECDNTSR